jgi:hypothetical protein
VKIAVLVAVPPGVEMVMGPVLALFGTIAVIDVDPLTVKVAKTLLRN